MVKCRGCGAPLSLTFLDLGSSPIANDLISYENMNSPEVYYPLHVMTCEQCAFVQLPEVTSRESLFRSDYVYFSSYSSSWLEHSERYAAKMVVTVAPPTFPRMLPPLAIIEKLLVPDVIELALRADI